MCSYDYMPGGVVYELEAERKQLCEVVFQQMLQHPLPWRIESDWTEEVRASDGYCIAKCKTTADAEAIIAIAQGLDVLSRRSQP